MPLIASFEKHGLIESIRELRKRPAGTYGIAIAAVGLAVALRMAVGSQLLPGLSFITFYPAIIIAALVGGFSRGLLATVLSALAAWYLFVPTYEGWGLDYYSAFSLALFCVICLANLGLVYLLDTAIDRALSQEQNVRTLIQSAPNGVLVVDNDGRITLVNASLEQLFGYKQSELLGREVEMLVNEITAPKHRQLREAYAAHPEARPMGWGRDLSARRKDGSEFPVEIGLNPIKRNGKNGVLATVIDVTERMRAQESQQLIIRELHHRTQNLFAVIEAIVARSFDECKTPAEAKDALRGRIHALATAYATVTNTSGKHASLRGFLSEQLAAFSDRISLSGCNVLVSPSAAQQFALIAHELATNALKYGALSIPQGRISIEGRIDRVDGAGHLSFVWRETGGPPASAPARRGFGSVILMDVTKQWASEVAADFSKGGLVYSFRVPLDLIEFSLRHGGGRSFDAAAS